MKVGIEGNHILSCREIGVERVLDLARHYGLDGVSFKTITDLSPTLDPGALKAVREYADALNLHLEVGLGRINPYNTAESPEIRILGDGDYRRGFERMIDACCAIGCTEMLAGTGTWKDFPGRMAFDRFRTDVSWNEQLQATQRFLATLAPHLRDCGGRVNIETHEEITSFEVVRLVESIGPDVIGITFDPANVIARCEDPVAAARRIAPYVHLMHAKDVILFFNSAGLVRQPRPCGEGIVDWNTILPILGAHAPNLHLAIEDHKGFMPLEIYDETWLASHPDLTTAEMAQVVRLAHTSEERIANGTLLDPATYDAIPWEDQKIERLKKSQPHLRSVLRAHHLHDRTGPASDIATASPPGGGGKS